MPASLKRLRTSGATVFLHLCETCGSEAPFGFEVSLRLALNSLASGDQVNAKRHLGRWYCRDHTPAGTGGL